MRLAMSLPHQQPDGGVLTFAQVAERARLIERIGFDGIWIGDSIGRGPQPIGKTHPEEDDRTHDYADARGVAERPGGAQATGVEQAPLARRERRDRGEVVRLERMAEAQQQAEAREGE